MTDSTFDKEVMQSESGIWFVRFFAPVEGYVSFHVVVWSLQEDGFVVGNHEFAGEGNHTGCGCLICWCINM